MPLMKWMTDPLFFGLLQPNQTFCWLIKWIACESCNCWDKHIYVIYVKSYSQTGIINSGSFGCEISLNQVSCHKAWISVTIVSQDLPYYMERKFCRFLKGQKKHINWAKWADLFIRALWFSPTLSYKSNRNIKCGNNHCSYSDIHKMMTWYSHYWIKKHATDGKGIKPDGLSTGKGGKRHQKNKSITTILDLSTLSSSLSLHPPPFLLTRIIFLFRCNLPPSSVSFSSPSFSGSLCLSVSLCLVVSV